LMFKQVSVAKTQQVSFPKTIYFGKNEVIDEMDFHNSGIYSRGDDAEWCPTNDCLPTVKEAHSEGNSANIRMVAQNGEGGIANASLGASITWKTEGINLEKISNTDVIITFDCRYSLYSDVNPWGHAAAKLSFGNTTLYATDTERPGWKKGINSITSGADPDPIIIKTKFSEVTRTISLSLFGDIRKHPFYDDNIPSKFFASLTINTISIQFSGFPQKPIVYPPDSGKDHGQPSDSKNPSGDPVNTVNGNMYVIKTDLSVFSPGIPFEFIRTYNSIDESDGPLGTGWTHNFNISLAPPEDESSNTIISGDQGQIITFYQVAADVFWPEVGEYSSLTKTDTGFVWKQKNKIEYHFNLNGILQSIKDRNGNAVSLGYNASNQLASITDTAGRTYQLTYDGNGYITRLSDPKGRTVNYQYDANNNLQKVINPLGEQTIYEYNDTNDIHNITKQTIGNEFVFTYGYDAQDRCIFSRGLNGKLGNSFEYYPESSYTKISDAKNQATFKYYNEYGKIVRIKHSDNTEENFVWDVKLNKTQTTNQESTVWKYEYDNNGNMTKIIDPLNNVSRMTYENDNLMTITDELGRTTKNVYDGNSNIVQVTHPDGTSLKFSYNGKGQMLTSTDEEGKVTTFAYDAQGNLISTTNPEEKTTSFTYDALGRKTSVTDPRRKTTFFTYDALSRVSKVTDALSGEVNTPHVTAGLKSLTDQKNNKTSFQYDSVNQLTQVTNPLGQKSTSTYDSNGKSILEYRL